MKGKFDRRTRAYKHAESDARYAIQCFCEVFRALSLPDRNPGGATGADFALFFARESAANTERAWEFFGDLCS